MEVAASASEFDLGVIWPHGSLIWLSVQGLPFLTCFTIHIGWLTLNLCLSHTFHICFCFLSVLFKIPLLMWLLLRHQPSLIRIYKGHSWEHALKSQQSGNTEPQEEHTGLALHIHFHINALVSLTVRFFVCKQIIQTNCFFPLSLYLPHLSVSRTYTHTQNALKHYAQWNKLIP